MSCTDSDPSSHGGEYKNFRQISRDRLLHEMLKSSSSGDSRSSWKVLIMDKVTLKVMSASCKMTDITDQGISLVEDLFKRRQPMPSMDVIYFIQPIKENIVMFLSDMSGREPLYRKAFIYFSCSTPKELITHIKSDMSVVPRIGALREMNLEYFPIESQAFTTDHDRALQDLYSQAAENSRQFDVCMNTMASRIATVFASLKEFPVVWYRSKGMDGSSAATLRDLVPVKLASAVWNCITMYKTTIPNFPQTETCEFLIVDRSVDLIAPIIHEWTYDAMCHDLLDLEGNKYVQEVPSKSGGEPQKKEFLLEDHDPVWLEMRHLHIAEASERLSDKMQNFMSKNKAAQLQQRDGNELSTREIQKMVQSLPAYNEQMEKLSLHVEIAGKINEIVRDEGLRDLGQLEQDLVFGDAGTKEVLHYLRTYQGTDSEYKLRLVMIYAMVYPEKFEGDKATKLMQVAKLPPEDIKVIQNMKFLEGTKIRKKHHGSFSLKFDSQKRHHALRKDKRGEEETWQLSRFYPILEDLLEKLSNHEMPKDEYQCMNGPGPGPSSQSRSTQDASAKSGPTGNHPHSRRSRRTATWAKQNSSVGGNSSDSTVGHTTTDFKNMGRRIFVFIVGGATRSELRVCHKLTAKLKREVVLGSTSIDDPPQYISKVKMLSGS
ncbi:protein transport Sec1a [Cynara cardunculus var. scolymus]|uniref:protein transport Sec1a n=1 Tax=Cynara cardunculus var. scolymus TaxID=59895 RepID=UPI000D62A97C|nr:protein transport Sec1a [Cynara cardunculus var. scolymus]